MFGKSLNIKTGRLFNANSVVSIQARSPPSSRRFVVDRPTKLKLTVRMSASKIEFIFCHQEIGEVHHVT